LRRSSARSPPELCSRCSTGTRRPTPSFRLKLEAIGFGVFIPVFFVTSGLTFDLSALFASTSAIARVPLFLLAILLARGLPALVYVRALGLSRSLTAGILQATSLPFIVAATQIGLQLGVVSRASAAGLIAAGLLSVVISPALGLILLRHQRPVSQARVSAGNPTGPDVVVRTDGAGMINPPSPRSGDRRLLGGSWCGGRAACCLPVVRATPAR
jgi:hypothetical protein